MPLFFGQPFAKVLYMSNQHSRLALEAHRKLAGKLQVISKDKLNKLAKLHIYYTPGVGAVASAIAKDPGQTRQLTGINNSVAVVSDGSSVLGLGDVGPLAALPVMEGKAMIFEQFAHINAFPIVLATQDPKQIINTVTSIAPSFGGINLEDIAAPNCFYVEDELKKRLDIPVMHDDQHGTAIVVLAALINAFKVVHKPLKKAKVTILGAGAAGSAVARILENFGVNEVIVVDSKGVIGPHRHDLDKYKRQLSKLTNPKRLKGDLRQSVIGSDAVVGVSRANMLNTMDIKNMANAPVVLALANPDPEILPSEAKRGGAAVIATGRSDYPNQVNNALVFPGVFRGALDHQVSQITDKHKMAAAKTLANLIKQPTANRILPSLLDKRVVPAIAKTIN